MVSDDPPILEQVVVAPEAIPEAIAAAISEDRPEQLWSAWKWKTEFGRAWEVPYKALRYGNTSDSKACGVLSDFLAQLSRSDRLERQGKAAEMIAEFLADENSGVVKARHCFAFFVTAFGGLGVAKRGAKSSNGRSAGTQAFIDEMTAKEKA